MRQKVIAGNWKMNGLINDLGEIVEIANFSETCKSEIILCPPITLMSKLTPLITESALHIGAQNCHYNETGAHTGEVSPKMLKDIGLSYVILGHSERRSEYFETNEILRKKILAAWENDLTTIVCVGESAKIAKSGLTDAFIRKQLIETLPENLQVNKLVIAYEPIWAIGTGEVPSLQQINETHKLVRKLINEKYGSLAANSVRIIYGGSVNQKNSKNIFSLSDVDGGLVGGASLTHDSFIPIIISLENQTEII